MLVELRGLVGRLYREDNAHKVRSFPSPSITISTDSRDRLRAAKRGGCGVSAFSHPCSKSGLAVSGPTRQALTAHPNDRFWHDSEVSGVVADFRSSARTGNALWVQLTLIYTFLELTCCLTSTVVR